MSYEMTYDGGGFVLIFRGDVTIDELNQANGDIHGHPEFDYHKYQIVDLLAADLDAVTEDDGEVPAATDAAASTTRRGVKVALVARGTHALNVVNGYIEHARILVPSWDFAVFSTHDEALRWARA